jgi:nitrogen fixation/metabolism regulation signal transduction histidine kinase
MKKWEYKVIKVENKGEKNAWGDYIKDTVHFEFKDLGEDSSYDVGTTSVQVLNRLGAQGWELVDTVAFIEKEINVPEITIEIKEENGFNVINIKDNARGVPEYLLDRIFEPYFTTKAEQKGSGLGLYMSKMIIEENMDGSLYVKNSLKGAIFTIKLKANKI